MNMNYEIYEFTKGEWLYYSVRNGLVIFVATYLTYKSLIISLIALLGVVPSFKLTKKALKKKRNRQLLIEFKEFLYSLVLCLSSGYSIENSIPHILKDLVMIYPDGSYFIEELKLIQKRIACGDSFNNAFIQFADRVNLPAIDLFVASIELSASQGGNLIEVLKNNSKTIIDQLDITNEIQVLIAEKQMEINFLSVFPFGIIMVLNQTSGDFMNVLYTTWIGRIGMTFSMCLIAVGILLSNKMVGELI